jgi:hypothetical protein
MLSLSTLIVVLVHYQKTAADFKNLMTVKCALNMMKIINSNEISENLHYSVNGWLTQSNRN